MPSSVNRLAAASSAGAGLRVNPPSPPTPTADALTRVPCVQVVQRENYLAFMEWFVYTLPEVALPVKVRETPQALLSGLGRIHLGQAGPAGHACTFRHGLEMIGTGRGNGQELIPSELGVPWLAGWQADSLAVSLARLGRCPLCPLFPCSIPFQSLPVLGGRGGSSLEQVGA